MNFTRTKPEINLTLTLGLPGIQLNGRAKSPPVNAQPAFSFSTRTEDQLFRVPLSIQHMMASFCALLSVVPSGIDPFTITLLTLLADALSLA
jgi:hypothetical protein